MRRASPSAAASEQLAGRRHRSATGARPGRAPHRPRPDRGASLRSSAVQRLQHVHARARQQRVVDLEGRVFGRRSDEDQRAVLDVRQKGVLLRFVEAVHLVEEQHRVARTAQAARPLDHRPDVLDAGQHRRQCDEFGIGTDSRPAARASSCRCPGGPHRIIECGRPDFERTAQRRAGAEQMRLPDELIERLWTQPVRQRPVSAVAHRVHCGSRPITSTPGGGEKENKSGRTWRCGSGA